MSLPDKFDVNYLYFKTKLSIIDSTDIRQKSCKICEKLNICVTITFTSLPDAHCTLENSD